MVKTAKTTSTAKTRKTKVFCDPDLRDFLYSEWLVMGYLEGASNLPKVLECFGMRGYITAYVKTDTDVSFVYDKKITTIRYFDTDKETEENECLLGDNIIYDKGFAIIDDTENSWTFFETDYDFISVIPKFKNYRFTNGRVSRELSRTAESLRNVFKVDKLNGAGIYLNINIPNETASVQQLDSLMPTILNVLDSGNGKDVCLKYDALKNQLKKLSGDFDIIFQTADKEISDGIFVREGKVIEYILSFDGKKISLDRHHNWEYLAPGMKITRKGREISFEGTTNEFELPNVKPLHVLVKEITEFISNNMLFVF